MDYFLRCGNGANLPVYDLLENRSLKIVKREKNRSMDNDGTREKFTKCLRSILKGIKFYVERSRTKRFNGTL